MILQNSQTASAPPATNGVPTATEDPKLRKACKEFEGVFFSLMLKEMRKTVPADPILGDQDHQQEIFQGMMDDEVSKQMSSRGDALSDALYKQLAGSRAYAANAAAQKSQHLTKNPNT